MKYAVILLAFSSIVAALAIPESPEVASPVVKDDEGTTVDDIAMALYSGQWSGN
jgi:hypothetical protein